MVILYLAEHPLHTSMALRRNGNRPIPTPLHCFFHTPCLLYYRGERLDQIGSKFRLPRSVQAVYLKPLRRKAEFGLPVCDLQLRSYSARHVEFFADFALRAAYYLNLPAFGPTPLPRITERWTVLKSNFAHKKSQENFERVTLRRLIQIKDGHPDVVQTWLAFLRKHAFHGVGMKANVWDHSPIGMKLTHPFLDMPITCSGSLIKL